MENTVSLSSTTSGHIFTHTYTHIYPGYVEYPHVHNSPMTFLYLRMYQNVNQLSAPVKFPLFYCLLFCPKSEEKTKNEAERQEVYTGK